MARQRSRSERGAESRGLDIVFMEAVLIAAHLPKAALQMTIQ
jgi:hypothetical protein